jgi:hypothetical protein
MTKEERRKESIRKWKERLITGIAVAGFCLSLLNFYTTGLRVADDLRVVVGDIPITEPDYDAKVFHFRDDASQYVFINAGTRSAIISSVQFAFIQPEENSPLPESGCDTTRAYEVKFQVEPFVVKPGEMISTTVKFSSKTVRGELTAEGVQFSSVNQKNEKRVY